MWCGTLLPYTIFFIVYASSPTYGAPTIQYRDDYVYNPKNDAFYKLHIESVNNEQAQTVCEAEGATLMLPTSIYDTAFVLELLKDFPDIGEFMWVGDGSMIHGSAKKESMDPDHTNNEERVERNCSVINRNGLLLKHDCSFVQFPFVCKVLAKDIPYDKKYKFGDTDPSLDEAGFPEWAETEPIDSTERTVAGSGTVIATEHKREVRSSIKRR